MIQSHVEALKEAGNELFRQGDYLQAAATYTKAIKAQPDCAVLYRWVNAAGFDSPS